MVGTTATGYTTRNYGPEDEPAVLELLKQALGQSETLQRTSATWQWKHAISPFGHSYVRVACAKDGQVVGMRAFMPWEFQAGGRILKAVRAVDTSTHPDFRRMGIFAALTAQVVEQVEEDGVDLIFNTPNAYSLPGYLKLGWSQVAKVHPMIKVLNYPGFVLGMARHRLGKGSSQPYPQDRFFKEEPALLSTLVERREEMETLLEQDQQQWDRWGGMRTHRTWDYLYWRYGKHPTIPYRVMLIKDGGQVQGCVVFRTNTRYGMKEVVICELILVEHTEGLGRRVLDQLRSVLRAEYLISYFPQESFHRGVLERYGFHAVPKQGIVLTSRPLAANLPHDPERIDSWRLTMGDLELF